ncbi:unnamed protein product [Calicophoron daubneyi]|uniref:C2H2-type domain-containing protein n=1 Tax=Calicophoron daubneyi TaxID=300641 RepID=A0AAV2T9W1_CALDB
MSTPIPRLKKRRGRPSKYRVYVGRSSSRSSLPPIATFSHNSAKSSAGSACSRFRYQRCLPQTDCPAWNRTTLFFCDWPNCAHAVHNIPFKKLYLLRRHMLRHTGEPVPCPDCNKQFTSNENMKRHMLIHRDLKPYRCEVCNKSYRRTSERSRCRKYHRLVAQLKKNENMKSSSHNAPKDLLGLLSSDSSDQPSALEKEVAINRSKPRPYLCPVCGSRASYTDPGSLRRHIRSHHPDYHHEKKTKNALPISAVKQHTDQPQPCKANDSADLSQNCTAIVLPVSIQTSSLSESVPASACTINENLQLEGHNAQSNSLTPPILLVQATFPDPKIGGVNSTEGGRFSCPVSQHIALVDCQPTAVSYVPVILDSDTVVCASSPRTIHATNGGSVAVDVIYADSDAQTWNSPVDLCNSAMCLQTISDKVDSRLMAGFPVSLCLANSSDLVQSSTLSSHVNITPDGNGWVTISGSQPAQDMALDLTEPQYFTLSTSNEAIDLSGDSELMGPADPIDLSASHQYQHEEVFMDHVIDATYIDQNVVSQKPQSSAINWDPEPGFSFTDLLTSTELDETDVFHENSASSVLLYGDALSLSLTSKTPPNPVSYSVQPPPLDLRLIHSSIYSLKNQ